MFSQCTLRRGRKKRQILLGKDRNKTDRNKTGKNTHFKKSLATLNELGKGHNNMKTLFT
jgi:hypothetical protein